MAVPASLLYQPVEEHLLIFIAGHQAVDQALQPQGLLPETIPVPLPIIIHAASSNRFHLLILQLLLPQLLKPTLPAMGVPGGLLPYPLPVEEHHLILTNGLRQEARVQRQPL